MTFMRHPADSRCVEIPDELWNRIIDRYSPDGSRVPHEAINMILATGFMVALTEPPQANAWTDGAPVRKHTLWIFNDLWANILRRCGYEQPSGDYVVDDSRINELLSTGLAIMSEGLTDCIEQSRGYSPEELDSLAI